MESIPPYPPPASGPKSASRVKTFGDVFGKNLRARALEPPRPSANSYTRAKHVHWFDPSADAPRGPLRVGGRESWYHQPASAGHWLAFSAQPSARPITGQERRKQGSERRPSTSGSAEKETKEDKKDERDDEGSIVKPWANE